MPSFYFYQGFSYEEYWSLFSSSLDKIALTETFDTAK